jgi:hypothetical protein
MPYGRRSLNTGPWHYCSRCTRKRKLQTELTWQRGKLLCEFCLDQNGASSNGPGLIGQREIEIANILADGSPELAPSPKLRDPMYQNPEDDILI